MFEFQMDAIFVRSDYTENHGLSVNPMLKMSI